LRLKATPESTELTTNQQPAVANVAGTTPPIDPLRVIEIALLILAVVLGIAALVVRRKQA
jgi:hypothetical protein